MQCNFLRLKSIEQFLLRFFDPILREFQVEEDDLDEAFRPFGDLTSLHLPLDRTVRAGHWTCLLLLKNYK